MKKTKNKISNQLFIASIIILAIELILLSFGFASDPDPFKMPSSELLVLLVSILAFPLALIGWGIFIEIKNRSSYYAALLLTAIAFIVLIKLTVDTFAALTQ